MRTAIIIFFVLVFYSCDRSNLGNGYKIEYNDLWGEPMIVSDKGEVITGATPRGLWDSKSLPFYYMNNGKFDTVLLSKESEIIDCCLTDIAYDSTYIVTLQKPAKEIEDDYKGAQQYKGKEKFKDRLVHLFKKEIPEKRYLSNSTLYYYWIINKKSDYIYGPLTKERYQELKDSLHIHLELKDTYEKIISCF